ncbi:FAD-dependent monooxygenase [Methylibium sp.]|uniref:FAD-dependent monooxygenase n=1 Tax=Methylibium sp. TaxID=2067992 RepID=UPI0017B0DCBC|nr:FAD-dependent monooxygenase [Methylibium sp.]MBA3588166.1 FAD-dependent monooxygenase [Methylibium sp.]
MTPDLSLAVVGAGPVGLALALHAAHALPAARISVFDSRPAELDVSRDPRTLALALGSVQVFERLGVWPQIAPNSVPIAAVHVSQQQPSMLASVLRLPEPELLLTAQDCGVDRFGAVASYGAIVAPLQAAWLAAVMAEPGRLAARFATPVVALKSLPGAQGAGSRGVEVDAGIAERFDLAVVAEGGVFALQARKSLTHDYRQTAWVGQVTLPADTANAALAGTAYERFTPQGPAALLPLPSAGDGVRRAALVWCVDADDDPVQDLDDTQRLALLNTVFHERVGRLTSITPLKRFALGLNAERTLVEGRKKGEAAGRGRVVRIGNAAQTLHPVAGQGLNLGLRDAHALVASLQRSPDIDTALQRVEWQRAPDRWALIAATDFLARSFTWRLPGLNSARGIGLAGLQLLSPAKRLLARQMMFGWR